MMQDHNDDMPQQLEDDFSNLARELDRKMALTLELHGAIVIVLIAALDYAMRSPATERFKELVAPVRDDIISQCERVVPGATDIFNRVQAWGSGKEDPGQ